MVELPIIPRFFPRLGMENLTSFRGNSTMIFICTNRYPQNQPFPTHLVSLSVMLETKMMGFCCPNEVPMVQMVCIQPFNYDDKIIELIEHRNIHRLKSAQFIAHFAGHSPSMDVWCHSPSHLLDVLNIGEIHFLWCLHDARARPPKIVVTYQNQES